MTAANSGDWRDQAVCAQIPESDALFFPEHGGGHFTEARRVCSTCPVRAECLNWAREQLPEYGMFGGEAPHEREAFRKTSGSRRPTERLTLTTGQAEAIITGLDEGQSTSELGRQYGVPRTTIYDIKRGKSHKNLTRPWLPDAA